jgi:outer membrane protein TolC
LLALRTWHDIGTARRSIRESELRAQDAERVILADVARAAAVQITTERVADVSRVALASALSTLELTRRRAALGAASKLDELRAEQEVSASRAQVITANEDVRLAREALGRTLVDDHPWGTDLPLDQLERTARTVCKPVQKIEARSDIEAAALGVEISERNVSSVDYSYAPTVDLTSTLSYLINEDRSPNGKNITWTVGAFLTWPLYDGGFRYGERTRAEAAAGIAREDLGQVKRAARIEVTQAERSVLVAMANLDVDRHAQQTAKETARLARVAYINGSGTSFDLVDTAARVRQRDIDLLISEFELIRAQVAAFLARANCGL